MKLNFVSTIGGNLYYLGDAEDENAPMVELSFWNEFAEWPADKKQAIAAALFDTFCKSPLFERGKMITEPVEYPSPDRNWSVKELIDAAEKLLEWMPIYSKGSSGHIRQMNLRAAIDKLKAEPVEYPSSPQDNSEQERMYVCLKCGAESWRVPSAKLTRCENGECSGQIVANPRRG